MYLLPLKFIFFFIRFYDRMKGDRELELLKQKQDVEPVYTIYVSDGSMIHFYCTEHVYKIKYQKWWAINRIIRQYHVYGTHTGVANTVLHDLLSAGFSLGQLLPSMAHSEDQKKAIIHAFVSMIAKTIKEKTT